MIVTRNGTPVARAGTGVAPPRALSLYTPNPMRFEGLGQLVSVRAV